jgi:hypothetical protein
MQFTYTIAIDDDYTPWGEPEIVAETTEKINKHEWAPYVVTVRAVGPIESEAELTGCVVPLADTGTFNDLAAITDLHLWEVAKQLADGIKRDCLEELYEKRNEITAMIRDMGGC